VTFVDVDDDIGNNVVLKPKIVNGLCAVQFDSFF